MTKEEIIEGKDIIAIFMGHPTDMPGKYHTAPYNTSWEWLMPVVEKVMIGADVQIGHRSCYINSHLHRGNTTIEAVFKGIIQYVKWQNEYNK